MKVGRRIDETDDDDKNDAVDRLVLSVSSIPWKADVGVTGAVCGAVCVSRIVSVQRVVDSVVIDSRSSHNCRTCRPRLASRSLTSRTSSPTLASSQNRSRRLAKAVQESDEGRVGGDGRLGRRATETTGVARGTSEWPTRRSGPAEIERESGTSVGVEEMRSTAEPASASAVVS